MGLLIFALLCNTKDSTFDMGAIFQIIFAIIAIALPFIVLLPEYFDIRSKKRKQQAAYENFSGVVKELSSDNPVSQLSAAILLRHYLNLVIRNDYYLRKETISVISAVLRTMSTGVLQKTLADGLAFSDDLSYADLQRTNLQNVYLGSKDFRINLHETDFFKSNLASALIEDVDAEGVIFYQSLLFGATIKNSNLTNANFRKANLDRIAMKNVVLTNANFEDAVNIPEGISKHLVDNVFIGDKPISISPDMHRKSIFFSMPGYMSKNDEITISAYRKYLESRGFEVIDYTRDPYPHFGQLSQVRDSICKCCGMIAFGTKQTFIKEGTYRPDMVGEKMIKSHWLSTPWNDIEVGMATMVGIPILLVKDSEVYDGIFDEIISESFLTSLSSASDLRALEQDNQLELWISSLSIDTEQKHVNCNAYEYP